MEKYNPMCYTRVCGWGGGVKNKEINNRHRNIKLSRARAAERMSKKTHEDKLQHSSVAYGENSANIDNSPLFVCLYPILDTMCSKSPPA